jgi:hypothetical protein
VRRSDAIRLKRPVTLSLLPPVSPDGGRALTAPALGRRPERDPAACRCAWGRPACGRSWIDNCGLVSSRGPSFGARTSVFCFCVLGPAGRRDLKSPPRFEREPILAVILLTEMRGVECPDNPRKPSVSARSARACS